MGEFKIHDGVTKAKRRLLLRNCKLVEVVRGGSKKRLDKLAYFII